MSLIQSLGEMPWKGDADEAGAEAAHAGVYSMPPQQLALRFFLGVVAVLFALFVTAYFVRMELDDWRPMPESPLLWFNTFVLFLGSVALQWTRQVVRRGEVSRTKIGLALGGLLTTGFIIGQLAVWREMNGGGYQVYSNPANSFFYVLTGLHALHILGGLWVWMRAGFKVWFGTAVDKIRLSVELCSVYWHFLLLVWLVLFALLSYT
jgi:cytochrome c oxidase subunit 3